MHDAYYNDVDPFVCDWLEELIADGLIPAGHVDRRSILDIRADDVRGYRQCHFFAGIGGWAYALKLAQWSDERAAWTGSCPCQPLSVAGKQKGHLDERHLWPAFQRLIAECRPAVVFGEQVSGQAGHEWIAGIRADLEELGYACGVADLCAAGVGAPHIRQRLYWVADALRGRTGHPSRQGVGAQAAADRDDGDLSRERLRSGIEGAAGGVADTGRERGAGWREPRDVGEPPRDAEGEGDQRQRLRHAAGDGGEDRGMDDTAASRRDAARPGSEAEARDEAWLRGSERGRGTGGLADADRQRRDGEPVRLCEGGSRAAGPETAGRGAAGTVADTDGGDAGAEGLQRGREQRQQPQDSGTGEQLADTTVGGRREGTASRGGPDGEGNGPADARGLGDTDVAGSQGRGGEPREHADQRSAWAAGVLIACADGKARRIEPGIFPLAYGFPNRMGILRGAGNAIVPQVAAQFVRAFLETE